MCVYTCVTSKCEGQRSMCGVSFLLLLGEPKGSSSDCQTLLYPVKQLSNPFHCCRQSPTVAWNST